MTLKRESLAGAPKYRRLAAQKRAGEQSELPVDRHGGRYGQGLISKLSVVTRGEARGHGLWLDAEFLEGVRLGMLADDGGVKSRFTHPGLSADGLATHLGRAMEPVAAGDQILADVHFTKSAHKTPDGDLADYVMEMAEESPQDVAISIVYEPDYQAEREFFVEHGGKIIPDAYGFEIWDNSDFVSPDPDNKQGLPHARLTELRAADFVGDPAANPGGLFTREQQFAAEADKLAAYAIGISNHRPAVGALGLDADRVRGFLSRFLQSHNLEVRPMSKLSDAGNAPADSSADPAASPATNPTPPAEQKPAEPTSSTDPTPAADALSAMRSEAKRFHEAFGTKGAVWFAEGLSFEEARARELAELKAEMEQLAKDKIELQKKLAAAGQGEASPVSFNATDEGARGGKGFASKLRLSGGAQAMSSYTGATLNN